MKKILTLLVSILLANLLSFAAMPTKVYAPYVDVMLWPTFDLMSCYNATGQKYFTLAFVIAGTDGQPAWGGALNMASNHMLDQVNSLQAAGGDVIISFGGANGTPISSTITDVNALANAYETVINKYGISWIDFDVEGWWVQDQASIDRRNQAAAILQSRRPDIRITYCLPVMPTGLTADGVNVINKAKAAGVNIYGVNIMAMDYGQSNSAMGDAAISAAQNTRNQTGLNIGITPMIGQNDTQNEIFYLSNASQVLDFANSTSWVNMIAMWSVNRDNGDCAGQTYASPSCSGLSQSLYAFVNTFKSYSGSVTPVTQSPFAGVIAIPGTVEMENYDNGGEGVAYHDADATNKSNTYRSEGVDIESCSEGGYNIDWSVSGEWLEYTVNVASSGTYNMNVRIASPIGGSFHVEMDGANISGTQTVPNTGGWQNWQTVTSTVNLSAGQHIMRFVIDQQEFNTNYISFSSVGTDPDPTGEDITNNGGSVSSQYTDWPSAEGITNLIDNNVNTKYLTFNASAWVQFNANASYVVTGYSITSANDAPERDPLSWTLQASNDGASWTTIDSRSGQDFPNRFQTRNFTFSNTSAYTYYRLNLNNNSGTILQLAELELFGTANNTGGDFSVLIEAEAYSNMSGIDIEACSEGGQNVGWIDAGDWMVWDVNIPTSGTYTVEYRVASASGGGTIQLEKAGGSPVYGSIGVPSTGGWQTWTTISHSVNLDAGAQQIAISVPVGGYNINWIQITNGLKSAGAINNELSLNNLEKISVYPNPFTNSLAIDFIGKQACVSIIDASGRVILVENNLEPKQHIDVSELIKGFYIVQIDINGVKQTHKIIKF